MAGDYQHSRVFKSEILAPFEKAGLREPTFSEDEFLVQFC